MNATRISPPRFVCCYQGCSDYSWNGRTYEVRFSCPDWDKTWNYTPEKYAAQRVATVGTIMGFCNRHEFPPVELEAFFPGLIRARFRADWTVEYADGIAPETVYSDIYRCTMTAERARELESMNCPIHREPAPAQG